MIYEISPREILDLRRKVKGDSLLNSPVDKNNVIAFTSRLIQYGQRLKRVLNTKSTGKNELLDTYNLWRQIGFNLLNSKYGKEIGLGNYLPTASPLFDTIKENESVLTISGPTLANKITDAKISIERSLDVLSIIIKVDLGKILDLPVNNGCYITKKGNDFYLEGRVIKNINEDTDYYKVFSALYELAPEGGMVPYKEIEQSIRRRIPRMRSALKPEVIRFAQRNLTDENNGFLRYADIINEIAGGKPLIRAVRGKGIEFNNKI